jgi:hypothetical protein
MYKNKKLVLQERKKQEEKKTRKMIQDDQIKFDAETKRRIFSPYLEKFLSQEEIKKAVSKIKEGKKKSRNNRVMTTSGST